MDDLTLTKLAAEAMGWHTGRTANKVVAYAVSDCAIIAGNDRGGESVWDPLHDDAQAMALLKKMRLHICPSDHDWSVWPKGDDPDSTFNVDNIDLNRAIVESAAAVQQAKHKLPVA